jgi:transcriptional regulator with XRE-family HTH domain
VGRGVQVTPDQILAWRLERGLTQNELARALGVEERTVRRWESGERVPPPFLALALEALARRIYLGASLWVE